MTSSRASRPTPARATSPSPTLGPIATAEAADGSFDVREFARTAQGSQRAAVDLDAIREHGLPAEAIRLVRILRDLERSTLTRLRNLLVTATHKDGRVTAFLVSWAYEKFWMADALDGVLEAVGEEAAGPDPVEHVTKHFGERMARRGPVARAIIGNIAGEQLVAAHVTTGLVDEWIQQAAYRRLGEIAGALHGLADRFIELKQRHVRFLAEEARRRLADSARARRLTVKELKQSVWPIGATRLSDDDRGFLARTVFGTAEGRAEAGRISEVLATFPGVGSVAPTVAARLTP
ncbi:MAG: hypothetical protein J0G30_02305 [Actinomycetales bacterium]|nr:hypothetical protein [Actinomycetales bacterium]